MKIVIGFAIICLTAALMPAQTPASLKSFASSADVQALIAKAKSDRKEGQAIVIEPILQFAPFVANLEYRPIAGAAAVHPDQAEMMYVIDGSGTLVTGGKLTDKTIEGGESRAVSKGDFLVVPEGTPHWFSAVNSTLVLMTFKVPRGTK